MFVLLIRPSVNTDDCLLSLLTCDYSARKCQHAVASEASKSPRRQPSSPPPSPSPMATLWNLNITFMPLQPKNPVKKKTKRINIWDDGQIKPFKNASHRLRPLEIKATRDPREALLQQRNMNLQPDSRLCNVGPFLSLNVESG